MKRAQIEEARRKAALLKEEEEKAKMALVPPDEKDFSVAAHLMRKHMERMNESLNETLVKQSCHGHQWLGKKSTVCCDVLRKESRKNLL